MSVKIHKLKTWPDFFGQIATGAKTFEVRQGDRGFSVGDILVLQEWCPFKHEYTGRELTKRVTYLLTGFGLKDEYVAMSLGEYRL